MPGSIPRPRDFLRIDRLVYLPVIMVLVGIWAVVIDFKVDDRAKLLQVAEDELFSSADTIADSETLLRENPAWSETEKQTTRSDLIQSEQHSRPGTVIWLESAGAVYAGSPVPRDSPAFLHSFEKRDAFTVHAAIPINEALARWRESFTRWIVILGAVTAITLATAGFLARILRRNAVAETDLRKRDSVLRVINDTATALAATEDYETVIAGVLASIGSVIGVDRVTVRDLAPRGAETGAVRRLFEWHQPNLPPLAAMASIINADFDEYYTPGQFAQAMRGESLKFYIGDTSPDQRDFLVKTGFLSSLIFTVIINGKPYCSLSFTDAHNPHRDWTETESDALRTLTGVMAAAMTRTHQARERGKVEAKLDNREAILQAVTDSAANLLNAQDIDGAIGETLATLGQAVGVSRVYITPLTLTADGRVVANVSHEWFKPDMVPLKNRPAFTDADVTAAYPPERLTEAFDLREEAFLVDDFFEAARAPMREVGTLAFLAVAVLIDGRFHGNLVFSDDSPDRRSWTPTEVRTLKTLTQLVGAALTRSKIEAKLGNRDAIMQAVTAGAASLLNTENPDTTITETLATLGPALGLSRVYVAAFTVTDDGRILVSLTHEWFKPGMVTGKGHPAFTNADVTLLYPPERLANATAGMEDAFYAKDLPAPDRAALMEIGTAASLAVPIMVDGEFRGNLVFADDSPERESWTPTEIATLKTLTQLVSAALDRAHYLEQRQKAMTNALIRERALEGSSQGITISDFNAPGFPIVYANPAFAALIRYPVEEIIGRVSATFVTPADHGHMEERIELASSAKKTGRIEIQVKRKDDSTFLDAITSTVISDQNGRPSHMVSIHEDVTELRKREELLLEARKMESVGHLTGGIAHDFNNLLTAVKSNAEDLRDELKGDELMHMQAEIILEAADRGAGLVSQLMAFARKQELSPQTVSINALIAAYTKELQRTLPANIEIDSRLAENLPMVQVDPGRLEVAIQNLAHNARDAMPDGGTITIETTLKVLDDETAVGDAGVRPGAYVLIAVTDNGTGMSREILDKAFAPFFTTKEVGKGTGLGLSMVYGFVKQSGGNARIYSEMGMGTVVKIYLPAVAAAQVANGAGADPAHIAGTGAILVVEDDIAVRENVSARLMQMGYRVVGAADAHEAIDILKTTPHFDLVFSDVIMPGSMNGADLVGEVRNRWPGMGVLLTSGYTETTLFAKIKLPTDVKLLSKPFSNAELASAVGDSLAHPTDKVA